MPSKARDPLQPFSAITTFLSSVAIVLLIVAIGALVTNPNGLRVSGIHDSAVCVRTAEDLTGRPDSVAKQEIRQGVHVSGGPTTLCTHHPSTWQQTLSATRYTLSSLLGFVTIGLMSWLVRGARRDGPFAAANARRVRWLGWWLIAGGVTTALLSALCKYLLLKTMLAGPVLVLPSLPWTSILTGLGILTVARLLTLAVGMREELEVTI